MRGDLLAFAGVGLLVLVLAALVELSGTAVISRHSDAVDLPWAARLDGLSSTAKDLPFNATMSDKVNLIWPDAVFTHAARARGEVLPLWNPNIFGGIPTGANPLTQTFYPFNWIGFTGEPFTGLLAQAALHLLIAFFCFHLWMRAMGLKPLASAFGGIAFAFSGFVASHLHNTPIVAVVAWIPLSLFGVERFLSGRHGALFWVAVAIALQWLAGFPQHAVLGATATGLYAAIRWCGRGPARGSIRALALLAATAVCGLVLSGPQLGMILEAQELCGHQGKSASERKAELFQEGAFVGLAFPRALGGAGNEFGRGLDQPWQQHLVAKALLAPDGASPPPPIANWSERTLYPGLLVVVLALLGAMRLRARGTLGLWAIGALGVVLATSERVLEITQGLTGFREGSAARAIMLLCLVLPALAARGLELLLHARLGALRVACGLLAGLLGGAALWLWWQPDLAMNLVLDGFDRAGLLVKMGVQHLPRAELLQALAQHFGETELDLAAIAAIGLASGLCLVVLRRRPCLLGVALALVLLADLLAFMIPPNRPVPREGLYRATPAIAWMQEHLGEGRFARLIDDPAQALSIAGTFYVQNLGQVHGLKDAQGWREQVPLTATELWRGTSAGVIDVAIGPIPVAEFDNPILDLARVAVLMAPQPYEALAPHRIDLGPGAGEQVALYRNGDAMPLASFVAEAVTMDDAAAIAALRSKAVDPRQTVILPPDTPIASAGSPTAPVLVRAERLDDHHLRFELAPEVAGYLVVTETYYPGWVARRGDQELPVLRAHTSFRAIAVPAGPSVIDLRYEPAALRTGTLAAGAAAIALVLLLVVARGGSRARAAPQEQLES